MEGGPGTLNTVYSAVTNDNSIPCVLVKGTGRTADLLVYAMENSEAIIENSVGGKYPELIEKIEETFPEKDSDEFKNETYDKIMDMLFLEDSVSCFINTVLSQISEHYWCRKKCPIIGIVR